MYVHANVIWLLGSTYTQFRRIYRIRRTTLQKIAKDNRNLAKRLFYSQSDFIYIYVYSCIHIVSGNGWLH